MIIMPENIYNEAANFRNSKLIEKRLTDNITNIKVIDKKETEEQERTKLRVR